MPHILILGALAAIGAIVWKKKPERPPLTTIDALIDPTERSNPNAENARFQMAQAIATNSISQMIGTAGAIETGMKMPKTAANLRLWSDAAKAGGHSVAGFDEIGAARARRGKALAPAPATVPDWLKFQATQSKLSGDPAHIRATAETMRRFGYRRAAEIHLSNL